MGRIFDVVCADEMRVDEEKSFRFTLGIQWNGAE